MTSIDLAFLTFGIFAFGLALALAVEIARLAAERRHDRTAPLQRWYRRPPHGGFRV